MVESAWRKTKQKNSTTRQNHPPKRTKRINNRSRRLERPQGSNACTASLNPPISPQRPTTIQNPVTPTGYDWPVRNSSRALAVALARALAVANDTPIYANCHLAIDRGRCSARGKKTISRDRVSRGGGWRILTPYLAAFSSRGFPALSMAGYDGGRKKDPAAV